jgi:hypothetical protein
MDDKRGYMVRRKHYRRSLRALPVEAALLVLTCVAYYLVHHYLVAVPRLLVIFTIGPLGSSTLGDVINIVVLGRHLGRTGGDCA